MSIVPVRGRGSRRTVHRAITWTAVAVIVVVVVIGLVASLGGSSGTDSTTPQTRPSATAAATPTARDEATTRTPRAVLATLQVKGSGATTGYSRDEFPHWADLDRDGCDTRNEVLRSQMTEVRRSRACRVVSGVLADPYSGTTIQWVRLGPQLVDIDHVVALGNAWVSGASDARTWSPDRRRRFANDPLNLLAVDARLNRAKGDANAAAWVPPHSAFRCEYAARQVAVKAKYGLSVTSAEKAALDRYLAPGCPLPAGATVSVSDTPAPAPPTARATPSPTTEDVHYADCAAVQAAGAAPLRSGRPGYRPALDGDRDGVACE